MQYRSGLVPELWLGAPVPGLRAGGDVLVGVVNAAHRGRVLLSIHLSALRRSCESCPEPMPGWCSALTLLVAQVVADHHDPAVAADHLALVADPLDARLDLHRTTL